MAPMTLLALTIIIILLGVQHGSCFANIVVPSISGQQSIASSLVAAKGSSSSSSSSVSGTALRAVAAAAEGRGSVLFVDAPTLSSSVSVQLPAARRNPLSYLTFDWVTALMNVGNKRPLELSDLWVLEGGQLMANASQSLDTMFDEETRGAPRWEPTVSKSNLLAYFWYSPLTRALAKLYRKELLVSGVIKLCNTLIQFLPSLLIAKILSHVEKAAAARVAATAAGGVSGGAAAFAGSASAFAGSFLRSSVDREGLLLALALYGVLCVKTFLENQYFDSIITMGTTARGAISAAIYRKALKLSPSGRQNNTMGEIVNYMQLDTNRMEQVIGTIHVCWDGPLQVFGYTALLLKFLGPSVFAGIATLLLIIPFNTIFLKKLSKIKAACLRHTDARVKLTNEILQGVRAIKSYNWEKPFVEKLTEIREMELKALEAAANTRAILTAVLTGAPSMVSVVALGVYGLLGNRLTPTKVFTALALFNQLRFPLVFLPMLLNNLAEGKVSLNRLTRFLLADEVQDYVQRGPSADITEAIAIRDGTFSWTAAAAEEDSAGAGAGAAADAATGVAGESSSSSSSSSSGGGSGGRNRGTLRVPDLHIKKGELVAIVGPVGSGKSTLLSALLGELNRQGGNVHVKGSVAYVPQSAWIPNDNLRNVILFGRPYERRRYEAAVAACALTKDLQQLEGGDMTEIGERGVNLSGGQKQRVSIARAVYDDADVYLLDDPLSALDAEVGARVFDRCIKGALRGKTRLLVTHQLGVLPEVDRVIIMGCPSKMVHGPRSGAAAAESDGSCTIVDQGTLAELLARGHDLSKLVAPTEAPEEEGSDTDPALAVDVHLAASAEAEAAAAVHEVSVVDDHAATAGPEGLSPAVAAVDVVTSTYTSFPSLSGVSVAAAPLMDVNGEGLGGGDVVAAGDDGGAPAAVSVSDFAAMVPPTGGIVDACSFGVTEEGTCVVAVAVADAASDVQVTNATAPMVPVAAVPVTVPPEVYHRAGALAAPTSALPAVDGLRSASARPSTPASAMPPHVMGDAAGTATPVDATASSGAAAAAAGAVSPTSPGGATPVVRKLMTAEERGEGAVGWAVYRAYLLAANKPAMIAAMMASYALGNAATLLQQWIVAAWTSDVGYVRRPLHVYLCGVAMMAFFVAFFNWARTYVGCLFGSAASRTIHRNMARQVLGAPLGYFESTPVGRLVQRFSKDLDAIDQQLPNSLGQLLASSITIVASMVGITLVTPSFGALMLPVFAMYLSITNYYRTVARELKRLDSLSRSPIFAHFSETLGGLPVIRSFLRQRLYRRQNEVKLDDNVSAYYAMKTVDRWLSVRLEVLGNTIVFISALLAVFSASRAGPAGISLNNALSVTTLMNWAVRNGAETESIMNSVERVLYTTTQTPQEGSRSVTDIPAAAYLRDPSPTPSAAVPAHASAAPAASVEAMAVAAAGNTSHMPVSDAELVGSGWPWRGGITFSGVRMRYREDMEPVLRGVTLQIQPGASIGIVGRTGSGKSSLLRALLRLTEVESGSVAVDGVDVACVGLDALRSGVSIIPQDPVLFSGTIRLNLDPFQRHSDEVLWSALAKSNLAATVHSLPGGLGYQVTEGGDNFSSGQRQLLCLARALVRRSRILLLDEATSSVDFDTDAIIQRTIRDEFGGGKSTVLTIAHRLDTVMDADKIMVMSQGQVSEYGAPRELLKNPKSLFAQLVAAEQQQHSQDAHSDSHDHDHGGSDVSGEGGGEAAAAAATAESPAPAVLTYK